MGPSRRRRTRTVFVPALALAAALCLAQAAASGASGPPSPVVRGPAAGPPPPPAPAAPSVVLYDQYDSDVNDAVVSTNRTDEPSLTAQAADDFVVPSGQSWSITQVDVRGYPGLRCAGTMNVFFYANAAGLPGGLVTSQPDRPLSGTEPDLSVVLSPAVSLNPGTYWLSVQCNLTGASWFWGMRTVQSNAPAAWKENGGYATACTAWGNRGTCTNTTSSPDQMFRLQGSTGAPTAVRLARFEARSTPSGVVVRWRLGSASDVLGFEVWRERAGGPLRKLNSRLVAAQPGGRASGYAFVDAYASPGTLYRYRLRVVTLSGARYWAGWTTVRT